MQKLWAEYFNDITLDNKGPIFDTIAMVGVTRGSIDTTNTDLNADTDWFKVTNSKLEASDVDPFFPSFQTVDTGRDSLTIDELSFTPSVDFLQHKTV
jgi:hypothetical protein